MNKHLFAAEYEMEGMQTQSTIQGMQTQSTIQGVQTQSPIEGVDNTIESVQDDYKIELHGVIKNKFGLLEILFILKTH